jgi:hypothetical protein
MIARNGGVAFAPAREASERAPALTTLSAAHATSAANPITRAIPRTLDEQQPGSDRAIVRNLRYPIR